MMMQRDRTLLSFLDVLCSALGAMILLAVIFSVVKNPIPNPITDGFILIAIDSPQDIDRIGLIVSGPDRPPRAFWPRGLVQNLDNIRAWTGKRHGDTARFFIEVRDPEAGLWAFQPYLVEGRKVPAKLAALHIWTHLGSLEIADEQKEQNVPANFFDYAYTVRID